MATNDNSQSLQELYFDSYSGTNEHIVEVMEILQEWDCGVSSKVSKSAENTPPSLCE